MLGAHRLGAEGLRTLRVDQLVRVAVTGNLVAGFRDAAYECGCSLREPAEHEEGRVHTAFAEDLQQLLGVGLHAQLAVTAGQYTLSRAAAAFTDANGNSNAAAQFTATAP